MKLTKAEQRQLLDTPAQREKWRQTARENGISDTTYTFRLRRGWTPEEAATTPIQAKNDPEGAPAKLRRHGFNPMGVREYRRRHPDSELTDDEIIQQMVERRHPAPDDLSPAVLPGHDARGGVQHATDD